MGISRSKVIVLNTCAGCAGCYDQGRFVKLHECNGHLYGWCLDGLGGGLRVKDYVTMSDWNFVIRAVPSSFLCFRTAMCTTSRNFAKKLLRCHRKFGYPEWSRRTLCMLLDADKSGSIDLDEFVSGCMQLHGPAKSLQLAKMSFENKFLGKKKSCCRVSWDRLLSQISSINNMKRCHPSDPSETGASFHQQYFETCFHWG